MSYAELREAGIDLPASVVSELELAGVPIQRCLGEQGGVVGVRLEPASEPAAEPPPPPAPDPAERRTPTKTEPAAEWSGVRLGRSRVLVPAAALAALAVLAAVVAIGAAQGGGGHPPASLATRPNSRAAGATHTTNNKHPQSPHTATRQPPPVPVSPALATQLEAEGHDLLEAGNYSAAVPVLKRAVLATGESVGACVEPASTTCLTYAYALYDLGRAERLSGEPQAAVSVLERRLQIDNQRSTVVAQLQLARQGIG